MKLTKKYLEKLIKEECAAMLPLGGEGGEEEMVMDLGGGGEGPPGAVDLPDDPNEAFGVGYTAALEDVLAAIEGLMTDQGPGEEMVGAGGVEVISVGGEEDLEEYATMGASPTYKRDLKKRRGQ